MLQRQTTITLSGKKNKTQLMQALSATSKEDRCQSQFFSILRRQDMFGKKVLFTYKGRPTYQTTIGAIMSILIKIILAFFIVYEFYVIFSRKHPEMSVKEVVNGFAIDPSSVSMGWNPMSRGFDIAIGILTTESNTEESITTELNPTYGRIIAMAESIQTAEKSPGVYETLDSSYTVELGHCNLDQNLTSFSMVHDTAKRRNQLSRLYCLKNRSDITLKGSPESNHYQGLRIQLETCLNTTIFSHCKPQLEIDRFFNNARLQVIYTNANFNGKEFNDPIQYYIDEPLEFQLESTRKQFMTLYIKDAALELIDSVFSYWELSKSKFFQISNIKQSSQRLSPSSRILAEVRVRQDQKLVVYGRVAGNIFNVLESIGGFYESVSHIGLLLVFFFQERLFKSSFIRQLYQVEAEKIPPTVKVPHQSMMVTQIEAINKVEEGYLKNVLSYFLLRARLTYGYTEIIHYILNCKCLRKKDKKVANALDKRQTLYMRGNQKLERELDVINLVKSIRQLRLMATLLLTPTERILLKFQRRNVIEATSSSSDSDHYTYDTIKMLNSKKDLLKLRQAVRIKRTLNQLKENDLKESDRNLFKGVFIRRPKKKYDLKNSMTGGSQTNIEITPSALLKERTSLVDGTGVLQKIKNLSIVKKLTDRSSNKKSVPIAQQSNDDEASTRREFNNESIEKLQSRNVELLTPARVPKQTKPGLGIQTVDALLDLRLDQGRGNESKLTSAHFAQIAEDTLDPDLNNSRSFLNHKPLTGPQLGRADQISELNQLVQEFENETLELKLGKQEASGFAKTGIPGEGADETRLSTNVGPMKQKHLTGISASQSTKDQHDLDRSGATGASNGLGSIQSGFASIRQPYLPISNNKLSKTEDIKEDESDDFLE